MAIRTYEPDATLTAQVVTVTVAGAPDPGDTFSFTVQGDDLDPAVVSIDAPATPTVEEVIDALVADWAALSETRWTVAKASASTLTITAAVAGVGFYVKTMELSAATMTAAVTTPNGSPTDWNNPANWSGDTLPATGDTVVFVATADGTGIEQGLIHDDSLPASEGWVPSTELVTLAALKRNNSFNGPIGTATYPLRIGASAVSIGQPSGGAYTSAVVNLNLGTSAAIVDIYGAASAGLAPVIEVNNVAAELRVWAGAAIGYGNSRANKLMVASGASFSAAIWKTIGTLPAVINLGGTISITNNGATAYSLVHIGGTTTIAGYTTCTALTCVGGVARWTPDAGAAPVTTANIYGGTAHIIGNVTTLNVYPAGVADLLSATAALTVTTINAYFGATVRLDPNVVTVTNPYQTKSLEVTMQA